MKVSNTKIAIKNSLTLSLTLVMHEIIQIGVINVVKTIKAEEDTANCEISAAENFIKSI